MKWKEIPKPIKVRLITSFFNRAVSFSIMPFMALLFVQAFNEVIAGAFLIAMVFVSFITNLLGGYLADRFSRKRLLVTTSALTALTFITMTISLTLDWMLLFMVIYAVFSVTSNLGRPAMGAIIIDATTKENRQAVYALDYWLINLSIAIGTALGGWLYVSNQLLLFGILSFTSSVLPIAYYLFLDDTPRTWQRQKLRGVLTDIFTSYQLAWRDRPFVKVVFGSMCILAAEFSMGSYVAVRLADSFEPLSFAGWSINGVRMMSIINIENTLLVVTLTFIVQRLAKRLSPRRTLAAGLMLYTIGYVVVTSANSMTALMVFIFIATIGELLYSPVLNTQKANMMPADQRGAYSAFAGTSFAGADLLSRSTILVGTFLIPSMMSVYLGLILLTGFGLVYTSLFVKESVERERNVS
ncbi:MFS transporter [Exiguobacterium sp. A1_3_1]|uniref:MFS transporter n=1 Tax=Exiguobacterium indicum TaxID=296995 RepID=A0ABU8EDN8_9BACL|nr:MULTISPECIES: MFS transporter [unclassified Exiguobacterium]AHA29683.1 permease [Exiguobacterium sp. MH3]NTY09422.1 MFS transporter [Exiguobacterium sp. JMULE1]